MMVLKVTNLNSKAIYLMARIRNYLANYNNYEEKNNNL